MLEETGEAYETHVVDYGEQMKGPEYLAINPMGKVPAIRHGDIVVTECAAICAYLADAFPDTQLAPPSGDRLRGPYYRWLFFAAGPLEAATTNWLLGFEPPADQRPRVGYGSFKAVMDALEYAVAGKEYIAGGRFSAVDVYAGSHIGWGLGLGTIKKRPAFADYWSRLEGRDAYRRALELDDTLQGGASE